MLCHKNDTEKIRIHTNLHVYEWLQNINECNESCYNTKYPNVGSSLPSMRDRIHSSSDLVDPNTSLYYYKRIVVLTGHFVKSVTQAHQFTVYWHRVVKTSRSLILSTNYVLTLPLPISFFLWHSQSRPPISVSSLPLIDYLETGSPLLFSTLPLLTTYLTMIFPEERELCPPFLHFFPHVHLFVKLPLVSLLRVKGSPKVRRHSINSPNGRYSHISHHFWNFSSGYKTV